MRNKIERLALRVTSNNQVHFQVSSLSVNAHSRAQDARHGRARAFGCSHWEIPRKIVLYVMFPLRVWFQDVLVALSREVHRALAEKKGARIDLSESYRKRVQFVVKDNSFYVTGWTGLGWTGLDWNVLFSYS